MSNTLNSISILQKEYSSKEKTDKDPVIQSPQSSEIEFTTCPEFKNLDSFNIGFETNDDSVIQPTQKPEIEFKTDSKFNNLDSFNTGFGKNNDLHYQTPCKKPELNTPLYQENYLNEFKTEEEKAAARHALGLYNNTDVVLMTLLTAENGIPSQDVWKDAEIKQMQNGYKFFIPLTSFNAVYDSNGKTLNSRIKEIQDVLQSNQKEINKINQASLGSTITSLQDVRLFLEGFNNGETLRETIDNMDQQMVRFEKTGQI